MDTYIANKYAITLSFTTNKAHILENSSGNQKIVRTIRHLY